MIVVDVIKNPQPRRVIRALLYHDHKDELSSAGFI
jgi:hypothetical protein